MLRLIAAVCGPIFVWRSLTYRQPIVELRAFGNRNFLVGFIMTFIVGFALFELIKQLRIHPLQYLLVGLALALFFLLLLSLLTAAFAWNQSTITLPNGEMTAAAGSGTGDAAAVDVLAAHEVAGALGGDHRDGDVGRGLDQVEVDVETVAEEQRVAVLEVRLDVLGEDLGLARVGREQHDDVGPLGGLGVRHDLEALLLRLLARLGALTQANHNLHARIPQVLGVSMPLGAIAQHRNLTSLDERQIGIGVVKHFNSHE